MKNGRKSAGPRSALPQQYRAGMSAKRAINASASDRRQTDLNQEYRAIDCDQPPSGERRISGRRGVLDREHSVPRSSNLTAHCRPRARRLFIARVRLGCRYRATMTAIKFCFDRSPSPAEKPRPPDPKRLGESSDGKRKRSGGRCHVSRRLLSPAAVRDGMDVAADDNSCPSIGWLNRAQARQTPFHQSFKKASRENTTIGEPSMKPPRTPDQAREPAATLPRTYPRAPTAAAVLRRPAPRPRLSLSPSRSR